MSEKGKNPSERSKGGARKTQKEQTLREQVEGSLREKERKPNRP
jgi:hypothetical protein